MADITENEAKELGHGFWFEHEGYKIMSVEGRTAYAINPKVTHQDVTVFAITDTSFAGPLARYTPTATLQRAPVSTYRNGYALILAPAGRRKKAERYTFTNRPRIIAANGHVKLPETVLYDVENSGGVTIKTSKFMSFDTAMLDAVTEYLNAQGIPWCEM